MEKTFTSVLSKGTLTDKYLKHLRSPWTIVMVVFITAGLYYIGHTFELSITEHIVPLFPVEKDKGFMFYLDFVRLCLNEMLWLSAFFVITWLMVAMMERLRKRQFNLSTRFNGFFIFILIYFFISVAVGCIALETFPNSSDEYAYLIQAKTLSTGRLAEHAPEYGDVFHYNHVATKDGIWVGRFPPGWPLILSLSYHLQIPPWLVNPILGVITLLLFYLFAKTFDSQQVAVWSAAIIGMSGFFIFNSASYFSHISCTLAILGFVWTFKLFEKTKDAKYLLLSGLCLGLVGVIRYYTAVLIFLPFLIYTLYHYRLSSLRIFFTVAVGSVPWVMFLLWYNFTLTGSAFTPVTVWAFEDEQLGFVKGHTVWKGFEHIVRRLFMFIYWCSPGVLILYFIFLWNKIKTATTRWFYPEDYLFLVLLLGHFIYYQIGGNQYGPRFLLEAFPFLALFVVRVIVNTGYRSLHMALLVASLIFAVAKFPFIAWREAEIVDERQDIYDQVAEKKLSKAVVIVSSSTSPVRPMPIGDLTRNGSDFESDVLYVQEAPELHDLINAHHNDRVFYRYVREPDQFKGRLIPVDTDGAEQKF